MARVSSDLAAPSEKFWALDKRIKEDKRKKGVRIEMRQLLKNEAEEMSRIAYLL